MTVNVWLLLLTLLLLWFPRQWLRLGSVLIRRRRRSADAKARTEEPWNRRESGDPSVHFTTEFSKFRNYVDLVRAGAGSVCAVGELHVDSFLQTAANATKMQVNGVIALKALIVLVGLLIQTMRFERRHYTFYPPIFYLAGLSIALCSPFGALFAFVMIWATNPALGNAQAFLTVYALLMVTFGMYFSGIGDKSTIFAGVLCFLPVLLSLLAQRPLVIFSRKGTHPGLPAP